MNITEYWQARANAAEAYVKSLSKVLDLSQAKQQTLVNQVAAMNAQRMADLATPSATSIKVSLGDTFTHDKSGRRGICVGVTYSADLLRDTACDLKLV